MASIAPVTDGHTQSIAARAPVPGSPAGITAFVGVNVVPMDTERTLSNQTVLVQHGWITALGPTSQIRVPAKATRIAGTDHYLIPGLGDCHVHIGMTVPLAPKWKHSADSIAERRLFSWLAEGVTTVRNMDYIDKDGGRWMLTGKELLRLRARAAAGLILSPRIYTSGQWGPRHYTNFDAKFGEFVGKTGSAHRLPLAPPPQLDSIAAYLAAYKAAGYDFVKLHEETPEVVTAVLAAAPQVGIPVVGHVPDNVPLEHALGRMRSIEHLTGYHNRPESDSMLAAATRRAGTWNCVTLRIQRERPRARLGRLVKAMQQGEVGLLRGTDEPGGTREELELLVDAGLTPYQALTTATRNMATYFNALDESGTVAVGKRADLVLLSSNPLDDIKNAKRTAGVMIGGRWLARAELDRRLAAIAATGGPERYTSEDLIRFYQRAYRSGDSSTTSVPRIPSP